MQDDNADQFEPAGTFQYFRRAIEIIKLKQPTMVEVARDPNALRFGIAVTAMGGALAFIPGKSLAGVFVGALFSILALFLFAGFVHLFCGYSKGKEEYLGFARIVGLSGVLDWTVIIPLVGLVATIWSVVISIVAAQVVYQSTGARATLAVLISAVVLWMIALSTFFGPLSFLLDIPNQ
ncbi:MAG: hypothetical protein JRF69_04910 [Deltaproteobacteria bacterium]|nr:hypothetical protein [Deltaproteobacteria bacterium]